MPNVKCAAHYAVYFIVPVPRAARRSPAITTLMPVRVVASSLSPQRMNRCNSGSNFGHRAATKL